MSGEKVGAPKLIFAQPVISFPVNTGMNRSTVVQLSVEEAENFVEQLNEQIAAAKAAVGGQ